MRFLIISESCSFSHIVKPLLFIEEMRKVYPNAEFIVCAGEKYASFFPNEKFVAIETLNVAKMYTRMSNDAPLFTCEDLLESFQRDRDLIDEFVPDVVAFDLAFGAGLYAKEKGIKSVALITGSQHPGCSVASTPPNSIVKKFPSFFRVFLPFSPLVAPFIRWIWYKRDSLPVQEACRKFSYPANLSILEYMSYSDMRFIFDTPQMIMKKSSKDFFYGFFDWDSKEVFSEELSSFIERAKESKLIYVSLGTAPLLILNNFTQVIIQVVMLLSKKYYVVIAGNLDLPKNKRILQVPFLNQHAILQKADCFVHYGGCVSMFSAFVNKVPQVVFPFIYDQHIYAEYYSRKGLLYSLYASLTRAEKFVEVVEKSMSDEKFLKRVQEFSFQEKPDDLKKIREILF